MKDLTKIQSRLVSLHDSVRATKSFSPDRMNLSDRMLISSRRHLTELHEDMTDYMKEIAETK